MAQNLSHQDKEHAKLHKILNFRFEHKFKKIGIIGACLIFIILLGSKFLGMDSVLTKDILRTILLLFLLIACLSKDELEDEYNKHIRHQSYVLAFVLTTIYAISIPLIAIALDYLITNITGDGEMNFHEISAFEVLFILMGMQLLFFHTLKKFGCEQICAFDNTGIKIICCI